MGHVGPEQVLLERVVTGRNRSMRGKQAGCTYQFHRLRECHVPNLNKFPQALQAGKSSMAFITVVEVRIKSYTSKGPDPPNPQQYFLLQAVFIVPTVKVVGNPPVPLLVGFIIRIKQVERNSSHLNLPDPGKHGSPGEYYMYILPVSIFIPHRRYRQPGEILGITECHLFPSCRNHLPEISIPVEQSNPHQWNVVITGLFQVISCQQTQSPGKCLQ